MGTHHAERREPLRTAEETFPSLIREDIFVREFLCLEIFLLAFRIVGNPRRKFLATLLSIQTKYGCNYHFPIDLGTIGIPIGGTVKPRIAHTIRSRNSARK